MNRYEGDDRQFDRWAEQNHKGTVGTLLGLGLAAIIIAILLALQPAQSAESIGTGVTASLPPVLKLPTKITNGDALSMLAALRNFDGRIVVIKQGGQDATVMVPWEFNSGTLRLRIARNVAALAVVEKTMEDARISILKELLKDIPPGPDGKPAQGLPPGSTAFEAFQRQYAEALNAPAEVTLFRIKASELKLDKNEIPVTALSALAPILDDDAPAQ